MDLTKAQMHICKHAVEQVLLIITLSVIFRGGGSIPNTEEFDRCERHVN